MPPTGMNSAVMFDSGRSLLTRTARLGELIMPSKYEKTIICLANSRKITGRCVAGKEIAGSKIGA